MFVKNLYFILCSVSIYTRSIVKEILKIKFSEQTEIILQYFYNILCTKSNTNSRRSVLHVNALFSKPPKEALASLRSLRVLNMDGNAIETLEKAAFGKIPALGGSSLSNIPYLITC